MESAGGGKDAAFQGGRRFSSSAGPRGPREKRNERKGKAKEDEDEEGGGGDGARTTWRGATRVWSLSTCSTRRPLLSRCASTTSTSSSAFSPAFFCSSPAGVWEADHDGHSSRDHGDATNGVRGRLAGTCRTRIVAPPPPLAPLKLACLHRPSGASPTSSSSLPSPSYRGRRSGRMAARHSIVLDSAAHDGCSVPSTQRG